MPAARVLLVLGDVALGAVLRGELRRHLEAPVIAGLLILDRTVAVQTAVSSGRVTAELELMDDGRSLLAMALGAFPAGPDELSRGLLGLHGGTRAVENPGGGDHRRPQEDGDEHGLEGHGATQCP